MDEIAEMLATSTMANASQAPNSLLRLPNEVIRNILIFSNYGDLLNMALVSRRLRSITESVLYRLVRIYSVHHSRTFAQSILGDTSKARYVKSLHYLFSKSDYLYVMDGDKVCLEEEAKEYLEVEQADLDVLRYLPNIEDFAIRTEVDQRGDFATEIPTNPQTFLGSLKSCKSSKSAQRDFD